MKYTDGFIFTRKNPKTQFISKFIFNFSVVDSNSKIFVSHTGARIH